MWDLQGPFLPHVRPLWPNTCWACSPRPSSHSFSYLPPALLGVSPTHTLRTLVQSFFLGLSETWRPLQGMGQMGRLQASDGGGDLVARSAREEGGSCVCVWRTG